MRTSLVIGNWKMHGSQTFNSALLSTLDSGIEINKNCKVAICPPSVYLSHAIQELTDSSIEVGAQNMHESESGAYTGEVSATMLKDLNCTYVLVGHSERRSFFGETDSLIASKFMAAINANMIPVLCVGETLEERLEGMTEAVVRRQIQAVLDVVYINDFAKAVIAYEPVWAIGTGETASPEQAQAVHAEIRKQICNLEPKIGANISILYGGSVKANNAGELFRQPDIDGGLVGGSSLNAKEFISIFDALKT